MTEKILWAPFRDSVPYKEPTRSTENAAAFDVYLPGKVILTPGTAQRINLNLCACMPENYRANFIGRSGISLAYSMVVLGGLVDADYQEEWGFCCVLVPNLNLLNTEMLAIDKANDRYESNYDTSGYAFKAGERIAQVVFTEIPDVSAKTTSRDNVLNLHAIRGSSRTGGFGSTGK